jgi:8-oxo-dGTP pyrophosphatase MutT (NUDIX family)/transcriptional regulator with XRE-family HTH domain
VYECDVAQAEDYGGLVAANIRAARARLGITQAQLAARMRDLGHDWYQQTAGATERGDRRATAEEIAALALCLDTLPDVLTLPPPNVAVVLFGEKRIPAQRLSIVDDSVSWDGDDIKISRPSMTYRPYELRAAAHEAREELRRQAGGATSLEPGADAEDIPVRRSRSIRRPRAQQPPIVAAIVTSDRGVLVGRRNDRTPPWTFIAGEQDAVQDESPADTAVREVKEETGLRIVAGEVIGERVHPKTGRTMIYLAATPTHGTDIFVGDEDELAEVRWVSLAEADELLPGMYEPVREHLAHELGGAQR